VKFALCLNCGFLSEDQETCDNCKNAIPDGLTFRNIEYKETETADRTGDNEDNEEGTKHTVPAPPLPETKKQKLAARSCQIACRSVRIGSYKSQSSDPVVFSDDGITMMIKHPHTDKTIRLHIEAHEINQCIAHFGNNLPILVIYASLSCSRMIRQTLNMKPNDSLYYDPGSIDQTKNKIIILAVKINHFQSNYLQQIFQEIAIKKGFNMWSRILQKVEQNVANEILVRSTPPLSVNYKGNSATVSSNSRAVGPAKIVGLGKAQSLHQETDSGQSSSQKEVKIIFGNSANKSTVGPWPSLTCKQPMVNPLPASSAEYYGESSKPESQFIPQNEVVQADSTVSSNNEKKMRDESCDMFGRYIANELKSLRKEESLVEAKRKINYVIYEAQMMDLALEQDDS